VEHNRVNLLSTFEWLAKLDVTPIRVDADRCLHALDRSSTCDRCVTVCPIEALALNDQHQIDLKAEACAACGQCLHVCPTGALTGHDQTIDLWTLAAQQPKNDTLEITCARHPSPEFGPADTDVVIRLNSCLAALGPSAYLGLLALGTERAIVRLDACSHCPIGRALVGIEQTLAIVQQILIARQEPNRVAGLPDEGGRGWTQRPVNARRAEEFSRRDFFRHFTGRGTSRPNLTVQDLDIQADSRESIHQKRVPRERQRMLTVLRQLPAVDSPVESQRLNAAAFARIVADEKCSACGACARACPTAALNLMIGADDAFQLNFLAGDCTGCGLCLKVCEPNALQREEATLAEILNAEARVLRSGQLHQCSKCKVKFASAFDSPLCPVCTFRRQNPFGSKLPPGFIRRQASASSERQNIETDTVAG
jgi:ferredoxin